MAKTIMILNGAPSALALALAAQDVEIRTQLAKATHVPREMMLGNGSKVEFAPHYPTEKIKSLELARNGGRGHSKQFGKTESYSLR